MPDIFMCRDQTCSRRHECYRHEAEPSPYRQTYMQPPNPGPDCEYFLPIYPKKHFLPIYPKKPRPEDEDA